MIIMRFWIMIIIVIITFIIYRYHP